MYNYEYFKQVDNQLEQFNDKHNGYGIVAINSNEWINSYYGCIRLIYVNMGDPYIKTLIYDTKKRIFYNSDLSAIIEKINL